MSIESYQLIGAYAIDAVDDDERRVVDQSMAEDSEYAAEMRSLRDAANELSVLSAIEPPASLRSSVLVSIAQTRPLPPLTPEADAETDASDGSDQAPVADLGAVRERRQRRWSGWLLSAAAAVLLVTGGLSVAMWSPWQNEGGTTVAAQVSSAADAETYDLPLGDSNATVTRSASEGKAVLRSIDLPAPPAGQNYQMWLQQDGKMVSAGMLPKIAKDGTVTMVLDGDAGRASATAMTLEPAGGSKQPTTTPMGLIAF
ncbi:anti-sigma factor [Demetria terragena]|uniref:anti-sigma factor n=1 Tax=Demetria terragena TaxID=63959 RepID=UPI000381301F|nr:anti-sigma factor [Demetria terragena]